MAIRGDRVGADLFSYIKEGVKDSRECFKGSGELWSGVKKHFDSEEYRTPIRVFDLHAGYICESDKQGGWSKRRIV